MTDWKDLSRVVSWNPPLQAETFAEVFPIFRQELVTTPCPTLGESDIGEKQTNSHNVFLEKQFGLEPLA